MEQHLSPRQPLGLNAEVNVRPESLIYQPEYVENGDCIISYKSCLAGQQARLLAIFQLECCTWSLERTTTRRTYL